MGTSDSMLSTDRDRNSSAETLLATPTKRKRVATAISVTSQNSLAIKKNVSANVIVGKQPIVTPVVALIGVQEIKETSH